MEDFSPQNQIVNVMESSCNEEHSTVQITGNPATLSPNSPNTPLSNKCMESSKSMDIDGAVATVVTIGNAAFNPQMDRSHTKSSSFVAESVESESSLLQQSGSVGNAGYLTLTGTIRRGKKAGQTTEIVVPVDKERLDFLESVVVNEENMQSGNPGGCSCGCDQGLHILLWGIFCAPFIFLFSLIYCFYMGTITWHNVFVLFSEEKSCIYKLFVPPILILCFPILVIPCAIIIALYSTLAQLSWRWGRWVEAAFDLEKGFFGWVCNLLGIDECAPYQEIVLNEVQHVKRPDSQP